MPPINLDNQVFFVSDQLRNPKIQRQKSDAERETAQVPQKQPVTPSNHDAIVIPSDDESDYEDSASLQSSSQLPLVGQLLADTQECGNVGIDERAEKSPDTSNPGSYDGCPAQDPMRDEPELRNSSSSSPDNEDSSSAQSSVSPCSVAVAEPISLPSTPTKTSVSIQPARELLDSIALGSQSQPDDAVCPSETDTPNGAIRRHKTCTSQSAGSCNVSAYESRYDEDSSQSHPVKSRLRQRRTPVRYASYNTATSGTDSADEDQHRHKRRKTAVHTQKALQDDSYEPHSSASDDDQDQAPQRPVYNGFCGPSSLNKTGMDENDDGINQQPSESSRRRKAIPSPNSIITKRFNRIKKQSASGNFSRRSSSAAGRYIMPSPPHSYTSDGESHIQTPTAKFEEWPLGQAVLKRVTINGSVTFQLQFTWETCDKNQGSVQGCSHTNLLPRTKFVAKQSVAANNYGPEEDSLIIALKDQGLSWKDIHVEHAKQFPERTKGSLQVRYCTKLKHR